LFEAFGPSRFAGWARGGEIYRDPYGFGFEYEYQPGEPMGRPVVAPFIRINATEENQTGNTFRTVHFNLTDRDCPLYHWPGVDPAKREIFLADGGEIRCSTASAASKDGGLETFSVMDESHLYVTAELKEMRDVVVANLWKRKRGAGTWFLETTTMYEPGEQSAAEDTYEEAAALAEGRKKRGTHRLYFDHRWGDVPDLADEQALRIGLQEAYGDALAWMDIDSLVDQVYDTRTKENRVRRYMLNAKTSAKDAWIKEHEWRACRNAAKEIRLGDTITVGFDGSWNSDATAIAICRVDDGHLELYDCWEQPEGPEGEDWQVPRDEVDAAMARIMRDYHVVGAYMDPPHWTDWLDTWHNQWAHDMLVQASQKRPFEWWTNQPKPMIEALDRFKTAVLERRLSYTPADDRVGRKAELTLTLQRHALNAREHETRGGTQIRKEYKKSPKKIDAVVASVLAWQCRWDAIAAGVLDQADQGWFMPKRIR
jgi:phage terminase large subunit-like protein